jgi:hypothetical protein
VGRRSMALAPAQIEAAVAAARAHEAARAVRRAQRRQVTAAVAALVRSPGQVITLLGRLVDVEGRR